jgi:hypothetical protein
MKVFEEVVLAARKANKLTDAQASRHRGPR